MDMHSEKTEAASASVERLLAHRGEFLGFLERRVGSRALAEDILQSAFLRSLERAGEIRNEESAVAWFYRVLRNAIIDRYRHEATAERALSEFAHEMQERTVPAPELEREICGCVHELLQDLKPEYRDILQSVEMSEVSVSEAAANLGISANNAMVRLHRARKALRRELMNVCRTCAEHGCLDCTCPKPVSQKKVIPRCKARGLRPSAEMKGETPWKTKTSRIAVALPNSRFPRGRSALVHNPARAASRATAINATPGTAPAVPALITASR